MEQDYPLRKIICNTQEYFPGRMPVWGIVLPKEQFLKLFQKEKGDWPTDEINDQKIYKRFGYYLPSKVEDKDIERVLPKKYFLESEDFIGVRSFGQIYSPNLERILGFEVTKMTGHVILFDLKDLKLIYQIRNYTFEELGTTPVHVRGVDFDMINIVKYFSGKFKDNPLEDKSKSLRDLVGILRFCGFEETNIF